MNNANQQFFTLVGGGLGGLAALVSDESALEVCTR